MSEAAVCRRLMALSGLFDMVLAFRKANPMAFREPSALYTVSPRALKPDTRNPTPSSL